MKAINERCCGIDVHKKELVACLLIGKSNEEPKAIIQRFSTMTYDLQKLSEWIISKECRLAAIESTGVYWKPVFNILEQAGITVILANAREIKNVPGRKTDIKDSQWIAELLRYGLIKASFIPPKAQRELRELTRYRKKQIEQRSSEINRIERILEDTNIKLSSIVTDITGVSAQEMILHLIANDMSIEEMADLAKGRLRNKITQLEKALKGNMQSHHRLILKLAIQMIAAYSENIKQLDQEIDQRMEPYQQEVELLVEIPGIQKKTAEVIISEIGVDMSRFPTEAQISSWTGISPGNNESAGKKKSGRTTKGNTYLRTALTEAAWAASRKKNSYLQSRYRRLAGKRGKGKAAIAVGHTILIIVYHVLKDKCHYQERGGDFFDRLNEQKLISSLKKRIERLGYKVDVKELQEVKRAS